LVFTFNFIIGQPIRQRPEFVTTRLVLGGKMTSSGERVEVDQTVPAAGGERVGLEGIPRHASHVVRVSRERITGGTRTRTRTHTIAV
jgi:hypothetical protein